jgi:hypothetical protein
MDSRWLLNFILVRNCSALKLHLLFAFYVYFVFLSLHVWSHLRSIINDAYTIVLWTLSHHTYFCLLKQSIHRKKTSLLHFLLFLVRMWLPKIITTLHHSAAGGGCDLVTLVLLHCPRFFFPRMCKCILVDTRLAFPFPPPSEMCRRVSNIRHTRCVSIRINWLEEKREEEILVTPNKLKTESKKVSNLSCSFEKRNVFLGWNELPTPNVHASNQQKNKRSSFSGVQVLQ